MLGFTSRWMTPSRWASASPSMTSRMRTIASAGGRAPVWSTTSLSVRPGISSMTMNGHPASASARRTNTHRGWLIWLATRPSCRNRSTDTRLAASFGDNSLTATRWPELSDTASYTDPIPPAPMNRRSRSPPIRPGKLSGEPAWGVVSSEPDRACWAGKSIVSDTACFASIARPSRWPQYMQNCGGSFGSPDSERGRLQFGQVNDIPIPAMRWHLSGNSLGVDRDYRNRVGKHKDGQSDRNDEPPRPGRGGSKSGTINRELTPTRPMPRVLPDGCRIAPRGCRGPSSSKVPEYGNSPRPKSTRFPADG